MRLALLHADPMNGRKIGMFIELEYVVIKVEIVICYKCHEQNEVKVTSFEGNAYWEYFWEIVFKFHQTIKH